MTRDRLRKCSRAGVWRFIIVSTNDNELLAIETLEHGEAAADVAGRVPAASSGLPIDEMSRRARCGGMSLQLGRCLYGLRIA